MNRFDSDLVEVEYLNINSGHIKYIINITSSYLHVANLASPSLNTYIHRYPQIKFATIDQEQVGQIAITNEWQTDNIHSFINPL